MTSHVNRFSYSLYLLLILMVGCKSSSPSQQSEVVTSQETVQAQDTLPTALATNQTVAAPVMQAAWRLSQQKPTEVLQSFDLGEAFAEEEQWTQITPIEEGYKILTVYNVYEGAKQTEFFVLDYEIKPELIGRRFPIRDLRMILEADTAYISEVNLSAAEVKKEFGKVGEVEVYELWGYEFEDAPKHGQLHYWSPQLGTIFQYFGKQSSFELMQADRLPEGFDLQALKEQIRSQLTE